MPRLVVQELSPRENEILDLAAEGFTDRAIAAKLGISDGTVGTYWGRIRTKLGPYPRTELIALRVRQDMQAKVDAIQKDRDDLAAKLHTAEDEEFLYEHVLDSSDEGVLLAAQNGRIFHANPVALRTLCYAEDELRSRTIGDIFPEIRRSYPATELAGDDPHFSVFGKTGDGHEIMVMIALTKVQRGDDMFTACFFRLAE